MTTAVALCLSALLCAAAGQAQSADGGSPTSNPSAEASTAAAAERAAAASYCDVAGIDAFRRARALGFRFIAERLSGEGECLVGEEFPWFVGRAGTAALICRFRGFDGQPLRSPLRVVGVSLTGSQVVLLAPHAGGAAPGADAAPLQFTLQVAAGEERKAVLKTVRLGGTACRRWRDAF